MIFIIKDFVIKKMWHLCRTLCKDTKSLNQLNLLSSTVCQAVPSTGNGYRRDSRSFRKRCEPREKSRGLWELGARGWRPSGGQGQLPQGRVFSRARKDCGIQELHMGEARRGHSPLSTLAGRRDW